VPKPDNHSPSVTLEPGRYQLILERLQGRFYEEPAPADRIAVAVLTALRDIEKGSSLPN
jgi:hypothetical protein